MTEPVILPLSSVAPPTTVVKLVVSDTNRLASQEPWESLTYVFVVHPDLCSFKVLGPDFFASLFDSVSYSVVRSKEASDKPFGIRKVGNHKEKFTGSRRLSKQECSYGCLISRRRISAHQGLRPSASVVGSHGLQKSAS
jgi:hypothetical protein